MAAEHTVRMGRRIKELRKKAGLTQRELAEAIPGKADGTQVSKWERGKNRPSDDTLEHIAKALGVDVAALHVSAVEPSTPDLMGALGTPTTGQLDRIEAMLRVLLDQVPKPDEEIDRLLQEALRRAAARDAGKPGSSGTPRRQRKAR
jgi:transcriptional regulator with XRE-family HTH domain